MTLGSRSTPTVARLYGGIPLGFRKSRGEISKYENFQEAQPVPSGVAEHRRTLRDGGGGGGVHAVCASFWTAPVLRRFPLETTIIHSPGHFQNLVAAEVTRLTSQMDQSLLTSAATVQKECLLSDIRTTYDLPHRTKAARQRRSPGRFELRRNPCASVSIRG